MPKKTAGCGGPLAVAIGRRVRERRKALGWRMDDLAAASGLSKTFVYQVEAGQSVPGADSLLALAGALSASPARLMEGDAAEARTAAGGPVTIPASLARLARDRDLDFRTVALLIGLWAALPSRKAGDPERFDWAKFYEAIRPFL